MTEAVETVLERSPGLLLKGLPCKSHQVFSLASHYWRVLIAQLLDLQFTLLAY